MVILKGDLKSIIFLQGNYIFAKNTRDGNKNLILHDEVQNAHGTLAISI